MPIDSLKIKTMFLTAAQEVSDHISELTALDSVLGDGDHGITMDKLMKLIFKELEPWSKETNLKEGLESLSDSIDDVSGGSAAPLFGSFIYGMAEAADMDAKSTDAFLKKILLGAYDSFFETSKAVPGNKSMMDAIYPATEVIRTATDENMKTTLEKAAVAAKKGSDATVDMLAKFGRARYIGERCLGHKDPGSVSFAYFYEGLTKGY